MQLSIFLTAISFLLHSLPASALTGGKAWVNFYKDCPDDLYTTDMLASFMSATRELSALIESSVAGPSSSSAMSAKMSASASASASVSASVSSSSSSASIRPSPSSSLMARRVENAKLKAPGIDIRAGECNPVPIVTSKHIDSSSVSVELQLLAVNPFEVCNVTIHEVPECIDAPLVEAPVINRVARSVCESRNFASWNDVWVKLSCEEIGTGASSRFQPYRNTVSKRRPVRLSA